MAAALFRTGRRQAQQVVLGLRDAYVHSGPCLRDRKVQVDVRLVIISGQTRLLFRSYGATISCTCISDSVLDCLSCAVHNFHGWFLWLGVVGLTHREQRGRVLLGKLYGGCMIRGATCRLTSTRFSKRLLA